MFKTIFGKIMSVNFIFFIICMFITSALLFSLLGEYTINQRSDTLMDDAERVNEMTVYFVKNRNSLVETIYRMNIEDLSKRMDGIIFIIDTNGEIVISSSNAADHFATSTINKSAFKDVLLGQQVVHLGNFEGLYKNTYLTVGTPIRINNEIIGATYLAVSVPEINRYRYDIFSIFVISISMAFAVAIIFSYFMSKRISKPLKEMSLAAKGIAEGKFDMKVNVRGNDEIAQLGETFNNMASSLQNLEEMRSGFIANISHELRTPMTTISGFIEGILDKTIPDEKSEQYLSIVLDETKRLARLVSELLVLAQIEAGSVKLNKTEFDINELIRLTILRFEKQINAKNINVNIMFEEEQIMVSADKDAIARVMTNLVDNALKFNFENGYINIGVKKANGKIQVFVENSGIGISNEELKYIWDRFYKTDKSRGRDKNGVGLGLYLVHSMIVSHDEKIWAESEPDKFARFTFTLKPV